MRRPDGGFGNKELDAALQELGDFPAVFVVHAAGGGRPYLTRTAVLGRRARRLLGEQTGISKRLNLREAFDRLEYWRTGSSLEAQMLIYELARAYFPDEYARVVRLRMPAYVKLLTANRWPRTTVTTQAAGAESVLYGPFRSRAAAEDFEAGLLEFFQLRRCVEDLIPSEDHPGCVYGEMNRCLRPCQCTVGVGEYAEEAGRAREFLQTDGRSLVKSIGTARDRLSADMEFEEAARMHKKLERVEEMLRGRDELAGEVAALEAVTVTRGVDGGAALGWLRDGVWRGMVRITFELEDGKPVSIDRKIREAMAQVSRERVSGKERQERLAILARWVYSSWRDGELIRFGKWDDAPVRKIVNAIGRVVSSGTSATPSLISH